MAKRKQSYLEKYLAIQKATLDNYNCDIEKALFQQRANLVSNLAKRMGLRQRTKRDKSGKVIIEKTINPQAEAYRQLLGQETSFKYFLGGEGFYLDYITSRFANFLIKYGQVEHDGVKMIDWFSMFYKGVITEQQWYDIVKEFKKTNETYLAQANYPKK